MIKIKKEFAVLPYEFSENMSILYFDTETTGLSPKGGYANGYYYRGQICQLSYIIEKGGEYYPKNFFFAVDHVEYGASKVNGLTAELLQKLSGGREFSDDANEIAADFAEADVIVAHNLSFDRKFMEEEFGRLHEDFVFNRAVCSMRTTTEYLKLPGTRSLYKFPSLDELARSFGVFDDEVIDLTLKLYQAKSAAHDARFDTVKLMLAVEKGRISCNALDSALLGI